MLGVPYQDFSCVFSAHQVGLPYRLLDKDAIDQLWACASEELGRQCHDAGATKDTTERDLLIMFKKCSIRTQNKLVNVVEFLN